jgi:hypothetical protein
MTGFVLVSFSGRVLVVQEVLRTVIIAPHRKAINLITAGLYVSTKYYENTT